MKIFLLAAGVMISSVCFSQITMPAYGGNKKASVTEWIGITKVTIDYNRPGVKGREGKIWNGLVHQGFADLHYGTSKAAPWRAGANENTTIEFSTEVMVEGKVLPAGKYGFFVAMGNETATVVFSNYNTAWGSFYYDPKDDALRVDVKLEQLDQSVEWLKYEFLDQTETSAVVALLWEKMKIPFKVSVDLPRLQIESFRKEFNAGSFYRYWQNMHTAAKYCLENNINLEEGLTWSERSINTFFGEANFSTLSTYSGFLDKFGRKREADSVMQKALPMGKPIDLLQHGMSLNRMQKHQDALRIFKFSYDKFPNEPYAALGMVMGHYHLQNKKEAVKFAERGRQVSTDPGFKSYFETLVADINAGKQLFK